MNDRIVLLGTGTCQLQEHRVASSILLELGDLRVIYDFGRGIAGRLVGLGLEQDQIEHIVLSHFHPDHLSDLVPFLHAASWSQIDLRRRDLQIYGPAGLKAQMQRLLNLFEPRTLVREEHYQVHLHEILDESFRIANREFLFCDLPPAGNHGLKFKHDDKLYAFTGDSFFHEQEIEFLRGVELGIIDAGHLSDDEVVDLAARTQAKRLVCSHLYRELEEEKLNARARKAGFTGRLVVGEDLMTFEL